MSGWIKLHRKISSWEWYSDPNTFCLFIHLLLAANHKPNKWRGTTIQTGEVLTGRIALSQSTGLSEQQIRTSLNKLKSTNEITSKTTNKYSIISIVNWQNYQGDVTSYPTNEQPTDNQQLTTNKNDNNTKNDKKERNIVFKPEGVSEEVWADFLTHRRAKKAPVTKTAMDAIQREAGRAGIGLQEALETMLSRGWTGFKAEWLTNGGNNGSRQITTGQTSGGNGNAAGQSGGNGYGGRRSQTELASEITENIKRKRREKWEAENPGQPYPSGSIGGPAEPVLRLTEEVR